MNPDCTPSVARAARPQILPFSDGAELVTPTVTGSVNDGYVVTLPVRVA